jgi:hypothetical protein
MAHEEGALKRNPREYPVRVCFPRYAVASGALLGPESFLLIVGMAPPECHVRTFVLALFSPLSTLRIGLPSQWAFELSRWRDGRCCMGIPRALLGV